MSITAPAPATTVAAGAGDVVTLVAVGDTALGVDPSEFAAIPMVVAD